MENPLRVSIASPLSILLMSHDTMHVPFPFGLENSCDDLISHVQDRTTRSAPASALECHDHTLPGRPYHRPRAALLLDHDVAYHSLLNVM